MSSEMLAHHVASCSESASLPGYRTSGASCVATPRSLHRRSHDIQGLEGSLSGCCPIRHQNNIILMVTSLGSRPPLNCSLPTRAIAARIFTRKEPLREDLGFALLSLRLASSQLRRGTGRRICRTALLRPLRRRLHGFV